MDDLRGSRKLVLKVSKKPGMSDSQLIFQQLSESTYIRESQILQQNPQRLEPSPKPTRSRFQSSRSIGESQIVQFRLPEKVSKYLESAGQYQKLLEDHLNNQKLRIQKDFNGLKNDILLQLARHQENLIQQVDAIFERFTSNHAFLLEAIDEWKQQFKSQQLSHKQYVTLKQFNVFDGVRKIRTENVNMKVLHLDNELLRRSLIFMAEDLEQQIFHKPTYSNTETECLIYQEIRDEVTKLVEEQLCKINSLLVMEEQYEYGNLLFLPEISTLIGLNRQNCMGGDRDVQELENLKQLISQKLKQNKFNMNMSLGLGNAMKQFTLQVDCKYESKNQLLSACVLSDGVIAVGTRQGVVELWEKGENVNIFQTRQPVTQMCQFKGYAGDFNVSLRASLFGSRLDTQEETYLVTGNQEIKIWEYKKGILLKQFKVQGGCITAIYCLEDFHTIVSGTDEGRLYFWNGYSGMMMKRIVEQKSAIHKIVNTKDGKIAVASGDRTIMIYSLHYVHSSIYGRKIFGDVSRLRVLQDVAQVYCLLGSMMDDNIVLSGGSDAKIKVWNIKTGELQHTIEGHKCPITDMVMLENPLDADKMFALVSLAEGELRISTSISPLNSGVYLQQFQHPFGTSCNPLMQFIEEDGTLKLILVNEHEVLVLRVQ